MRTHSGDQWSNPSIMEHFEVSEKLMMWYNRPVMKNDEYTYEEEKACPNRGWRMINECNAKLFCSEDVSLIENYHEAIADKEKMWDVHHRRECDENGRTLFTGKQLIEMGLYFKRPAAELIFVTRSMHWKLHREMLENSGKNVGKSPSKIEKQSIPILQFTKSGELVKEWPSLREADRQLGIPHQNICNCLKGRYKSAGGFVWRYKWRLLWQHFDKEEEKIC